MANGLRRGRWARRECKKQDKSDRTSVYAYVSLITRKVCKRDGRDADPSDTSKRMSKLRDVVAANGMEQRKRGGKERYMYNFKRQRKTEAKRRGPPLAISEREKQRKIKEESSARERESR